MKFKCEEMANKILPAIRAEIAIKLYREYGIKQIEISKILGITQGAVSHYLTSFRGKEREIINNNPEIEKEMNKLVSLMLRGEFDEEIICRICKIINSSSNP